MPDSLKPAAPEKAALNVVAFFLSEYIPGVKNEYAMMEKASDGPLKISLPDLQMEVLIFALHCVDRAVIAFWGAEYRAAFMDCAFGAACHLMCEALPEQVREQFAGCFERHCATRQREYAAMTPLVGADGESGNVLAYEFGEKICFDAGVQNVDAIAAMISGAQSIFIMMMKIAKEL